MTMTCITCPTGCLTCSSGTDCTRCTSGYFLYLDPTSQYQTCIQACPTGYYSAYSSSVVTYVCSQCDTSCAACNGSSSSQCTDCADDMILSSGSCYSSSFTCPDGTYLDSWQCFNCTKGCAICSEVTSCIVCLSGYTLGTTTGLCEISQSLCDSSCNTCSGTTQYDCTSCSSPLVLQTGMCARSCSPGFTYNVMTFKCEICFESCTSCIAELFYYGGNCVFSCPSETTVVIDEFGQISCLLEGDTPLIAFSQYPSATEVVALNQDLNIQVAVTYPSSTSSSQTNSINWIQTDINAPATQLLAGISYLNTATLVIPKSNLTPNTYYELTIEVLTNNKTTATSSISFNTAKDIISGNFDIAPSTGSFFNTTFLLTISGWSDNTANGISLNFTIIASRTDNPLNNLIIASSLDLLSSTDGYQFTIPSLFEAASEESVVYQIELRADSSSDTISVYNTIVLQTLSSSQIAELIANTEPSTLTESTAMASFAIMVARSLVQNSSLETQTTNNMIRAFQAYQALTGDTSVTCVDSIHCSGYGTCIATTGTTDSTNPLCTCNSGWGGRSCNKDAQQLQEAQEDLEIVMTNLLRTSPTTSTVASQLLAINSVVADPDLFASSSTVPILMANTVIASYDVIVPSSSSTTQSSASNSQALLSSLVNAAFTLPFQFSSVLDDSIILDELTQLFGDSVLDLLALLGLGDFTELDSDFLYMFLISVDDLFEEITDDEDDSDPANDRRILQQQEQLIREGTVKFKRQPRMTTTADSSTSSSDGDKQEAALQNKAATQSPFTSSTSADVSKLVQLLQALLSTLSSGRKVQLKSPANYSTTSGAFTIPKVTLQVSSSIKFSVQETGKNNQASNSDSLITNSVTFSATDGTTPVSISNLATPIQMTIPKTTPTPPSSSGSSTYQCSYYDETSKKFLTNGCTFIGENLTDIFCQCNHATEFAVIVNEETLNSGDNLYKPSLSELLALSATQTTSKNQTFTLQLQKNILAKIHTAVYKYTISRFNFWPIGISIIILATLLILYKIISLLPDVKRDYLASWSDELQNIDQKTEAASPNSYLSARCFWTFYSLVQGDQHKYFIDNSTRVLSFYTEVMNLMGNVMLWSLFSNSQKGRNLLISGQFTSYIFIIVVSLITASASFYITLGLASFVRMIILRKHYRRIEKDLTSLKNQIVRVEFIFKATCVIVILIWLALFAVLSTLLMNAEVVYWLGCCLGAAILSYLVMDGILVAIFRIFRPRKMFVMLALRAMSNKYIFTTILSELNKSQELCISDKIEPISSKTASNN